MASLQPNSHCEAVKSFLAVSAKENESDIPVMSPRLNKKFPGITICSWKDREKIDILIEKDSFCRTSSLRNPIREKKNKLLNEDCFSSKRS